MKITIASTNVDEKPWSKPDGRSGVIRTQLATAETRRFRAEIRLDLGKVAPAYAAGEYAVDLDEAVNVGSFGDLQLMRALPLVLVKAAVTKVS